MISPSKYNVWVWRELVGPIPYSIMEMMEYDVMGYEDIDNANSKLFVHGGERERGGVRERVCSMF